MGRLAFWLKTVLTLPLMCLAGVFVVVVGVSVAIYEIMRELWNWKLDQLKGRAWQRQLRK